MNLAGTAAAAQTNDEDTTTQREQAENWFLDGQFVVATPQVLYEGMPGDHDLGAAILLEPAHRTQP